eukprot:g45947.t1
MELALLPPNTRNSWAVLYHLSFVKKFDHQSIWNWSACSILKTLRKKKSNELTLTEYCRLAHSKDRHVPKRKNDQDDLDNEGGCEFSQKKEEAYELTKVIDDSRAVDVNYVDFNRAFDKVPHSRLIQKIKMHGIHVTWPYGFKIVLPIGD